jgi:putative tryptophan/tyrosine transport system substrate-binding protein
VRRREFLGVLGCVAAGSLPVSAQQPAMPVIGFLGSTSPDLYAHLVRAYQRGLSEAGFVDGRNVVIEFRWAESQYDRLPALAAELVRRQVAVITAGAFPAALAAKAATKTIPVVFSIGVDPVGFGLVTSMNQPGGNLTGVTNLNLELGPKQLEVLRELVSTTKIAALLVNPTNPNAQAQANDVQVAARTLGLDLHVLHASTDGDIDAAFATLARLRVGALVIGADAFLVSRSEHLGALTASHAVPAVYQFREFAVAGCLMTYGSSITDVYRLVGVYTGRILKGDKPADLPVMQSTKVELIINMKAAKALGLTVPLSLLGRADEVIE